MNPIGDPIKSAFSLRFVLLAGRPVAGRPLVARHSLHLAAGLTPAEPFNQKNQEKENPRS